jgi:hypothetical protein
MASSPTLRAQQTLCGRSSHVEDKGLFILNVLFGKQAAVSGCDCCNLVGLAAAPSVSRLCFAPSPCTREHSMVVVGRRVTSSKVSPLLVTYEVRDVTSSIGYTAINRTTRFSIFYFLASSLT